METTQTERDEVRGSADENMRREFQIVPVPLDLVRRVVNDADRLARYERDLHDDIGKDRSQDTDWLRAGFLQRGAQIERLEDGIRALVDEIEPDDSVPHWVFRRIDALLDD